MSKWLDRFRADEDDIVNPYRQTGAPLMNAAVLRALLTAPDAVVGPACSDVDVPPTINMEEDFREAYVQGYRHALSDLRAALQAGRPEPPPQDDDAIKPCPFCGGVAEIIAVEEPSNVGGYVVQCRLCEASTRVWFPIKDDVKPILRDAWNRRSREGDRPPEDKS